MLNVFGVFVATNADTDRSSLYDCISTAHTLGYSAAVSSIWWTLLKDLVQFICSAELVRNEHYKSNLCLVSSRSTFLTPSTGP